MPDPDFQEYVRHRDPEAFRRVVERHIGAVHSAAARVLWAREAGADDVVQTVFALLARKAAVLPEDLVVGAWLHRQTVRRALNLLRTEKRRERRERHFEETRVMIISDNAKLWSDLRPHLDNELLRLPEAQRSALVLRYLEERSLGEVGECLGVTPNAAQKLVARALERPRRNLGHRRVVLTGAVLGNLLAEHPAKAATDHVSASVVTANALSAAACQSAAPAAAMTLLFHGRPAACAGVLILCAVAGWRGVGRTPPVSHSGRSNLPAGPDFAPASAPPLNAWLSAVGAARAEDFPSLAAEALREPNLPRRHERLEAVFARWVEVRPEEGWVWVREHCAEELRENRLPRDPRLAFLVSWAAVDGPTPCPIGPLKTWPALWAGGADSRPLFRPAPCGESAWGCIGFPPRKQRVLIPGERWLSPPGI